MGLMGGHMTWRRMRNHNGLSKPHGPGLSSDPRQPMVGPGPYDFGADPWVQERPRATNYLIVGDMNRLEMSYTGEYRIRDTADPDESTWGLALVQQIADETGVSLDDVLKVTRYIFTGPR